MNIKKTEKPNPWTKPTGGFIKWIKEHGRTFNDTTLFVSQKLGNSLFVWFLVGIALSLPGILWLAQVNLKAVGEDWQGNAGLTVFFEPSVDEIAINSVLEQLAQMPQVKKTSLTNADQALQQFISQTSNSAELSKILSTLESNPLPASIQVTVRESSSFIQLEALQRQIIGQWPVNDVVIEKSWLERLSYLKSLLNRLGGILGLLFVLGAVFVTSASVRLAIESRLEELRVLSLVGATSRQMRRPFIYFGACYGLGGGVMAVMFLALILNGIEEPLGSLLASYQVPLQIKGFDGQFLGSVISAGVLLGITGAWVAVLLRLHRTQFL
jgi:cell division transport system permease protein